MDYFQTPLTKITEDGEFLYPWEVVTQRELIDGGYWNGNGGSSIELNAPYITEIPINDYISIQTEVEITELIANPSTVFSTKDGVSEGIQLRIETTKQARILVSNTALVLDSSVMSDGHHIVELRIHSDGLHEFYIDGSIDTSITNIGAIGLYNFGKNQWFSRDGVEASVLKHYTAKLMKNSTSGKLETQFESKDKNNVQFFNRTSGEVVIGEIQSPTNDNLVSTGVFDGDMNDNGYTLARALNKNLFNGDLAQFGFFVDGNGDIQSSGSANWLSSPIIVEPNTEYTVKSISNMGRGVSYDEDGNKIGLVFDQLPTSDTKTFTTQSNAKTIVFHVQTSTTENVQLELGNTPTTYEPWVGYYYNSALTLPVSDGTLGYNVDDKSTFYTSESSPLRAESDFTGKFPNPVEQEAIKDYYKVGQLYKDKNLTELFDYGELIPPGTWYLPTGEPIRFPLGKEIELMKTTYKKPYAILQEHVNIPLLHETGATASEKNVVIRVADQDIEMYIEGFGARRLVGAGNVQVEVCVFELKDQVTDGTILDPESVISANLDRSGNRDKIGLEIFENPTVVLDANDVRMYQGGAVVSGFFRQTVDKVGDTQYSLKRNTDYLLRSSILAGDTGDCQSDIVLDLILTNEDVE